MNLGRTMGTGILLTFFYHLEQIKYLSPSPHLFIKDHSKESGFGKAKMFREIKYLSPSPTAAQDSHPEKYLESYVRTYLEEEVKYEGLTRNLGSFSRFLEAASFSQGSVLNITKVAR